MGTICLILSMEAASYYSSIFSSGPNFPVRLLLAGLCWDGCCVYAILWLSFAMSDSLIYFLSSFLFSFTSLHSLPCSRLPGYPFFRLSLFQAIIFSSSLLLLFTMSLFYRAVCPEDLDTEFFYRHPFIIGFIIGGGGIEGIGALGASLISSKGYKKIYIKRLPLMNTRSTLSAQHWQWPSLDVWRMWERCLFSSPSL